MADSTLSQNGITPHEASLSGSGRPLRKRKSRKTSEEMSFASLDAYLISEEPEADSGVRTTISKKRKVKSDDDDFVSNYDTPPFGQANTADTQHIKDLLPVTVQQGQDAPSTVHSKQPAKTSKKEAALFYTDETAEKPEPIGQPAVWADKRQQLTETLSWYKTNQASAYTNNGMVYGFLIDKAVSPRDIFNDDIIICTVGGGKEKDHDGKMVLADDHKADHSRANPFRAAMKLRQIVGVIVGQGNKNCPVKLSHYYSVLGYYHITDVWYDKYEKKCWMIRAERISPLWCSPQTALTAGLLPSPTGARPLMQTCVHCNQPSKQIYTEGWVCMNAHCKHNWDFGREVDTTSLIYHPDFLAERTQYVGEIPALFAPLPVIKQSSANSTTLSKQGIVCPKCNCCTRRIHWTYWACENKNCDFELHASTNIMTIAEAKIVSDAKWKAKKSLVAGGINEIEMNLGAYPVTKYLIPDEKGEVIGFVAVFKSNQLINQQPDGPNDLFRQIQEPEFDLKRNSARGGDSTVQMLTNHYGRNFGSTYKFGVQQESQGFDVSPDVILKILMRTGWAANQAALHHTPDGAAYGPPNELLCLGYYADNKIDYHDDGEQTLGPTVISLSLGCSATMCFRPKAKSTMGISSNAKGSKPDVLRFQLHHGDMMVMHGAKIQKLFEHCVIPYGRLRFALTARQILHNKIPDLEERAQAIAAGTIPQRAAAFIYDGDVMTLFMQPPADQQSLEEVDAADGAAEFGGEI